MTTLEPRVAKLERDMENARRDQDEIRELAAGASRDVADTQAGLRAHIKTLDALRKTQLDQGEEMRRGFAAVRAETRAGLTEVRSEITDVRSEMREGFTKLGLGMAQITAQLNTAIGRDEPHHD